MRLRQAQQALWRAVRYDPTPADALSLFAGDGRLDAAQRLAIYRNMYWYRQVDALAQAFPRLREALGAEAFTKLVCKYIRHHPSQHPALEYLGRRLPDFARQHAPGYAGLARLEWTRNLALLAPESAGPARLSDVHPRTFPAARLSFVRSFHLIEVDSKALSAFGSPSSGEEPAIAVAVWRHGFGVRHLALGRAEAVALGRAREGASVAQVLDEVPTTSTGIGQAFEMIRAWLVRHWIERILT